MPTIVRLPGQNRPEPALRALTGIQDLLPTFLEVAGVPNPGNVYKGQPKNPITGVSLLPLLTGRADRVRQPTDGHPAGQAR